MWEIPIFAAEKKDGLSHLVRSSASINYLSPAKIAAQEKQELIKSLFESTTASANKGQTDLFYLDTILVSTGWNLNDDIFTKEPTWAARHSPEDKPFNYGHDQLDIIGHITSNCAVDTEYTAIADDSTLDDVPDKFHILTGSVIYKAWADKKQAERIEKIISEIAEDKWFVSMECLFCGFNYGFATAGGEYKIVARDEDSAFLTKHLRAYGGNGKYKGDKIGRVVSSLIFSGKGLVEKPANPESIIFNNVTSFKSTFANLGYINSSEVDNNLNNNEELNMADTEKTVSELSKALELVQAEKAELAKQLKDSQTQAAKASEDKVNALTVAVEDEKKKIKTAEEKAAKAEADLTEVKAELAQAKSDNEALKKTEDEFKKASKTSKAGLTEEEATAFLADWADADEKTFDKALALIQKAKAGTGSLDKPDGVKKVAEIKFGDDSGAQKVNAGGTKVTPTDNLGTAAAAVVASADATPSAGAAAAANVGEVESSRAALSTFIEGRMKNSKSRKR